MSELLSALSRELIMKHSFFGRALPAVAIVALSLASVPAWAGIYSSMVVFGDSLSDSGNDAFLGAIKPAQVISGNTYIPGAAYASGTFSNGPVWASDAASALGLPLQPSLLGGTNFAFGGATTGGAGAIPNLIQQANIYLGLTGNVASPTALYVIEGGGSDARVASCVANVGKIVGALQAAGAHHIVVWDTPNLGLAPAVRAGGLDTVTFATSLAQLMNAALTVQLMGDPGVSIFDIFGLGTSIGANPAAFGLTNVTDACGAPSNGCDPATAEYWDGIHPTAAAHLLIADAFLAVASARTIDVGNVDPGLCWPRIGVLPSCIKVGHAGSLTSLG